MEKKKESPEKMEPLTYYGKKAYRLHPLLARLKPREEKIADYRYENVTGNVTRGS